jgi:adenosylcobinamide-GDP ribazoletransferase
MRQNKKIERIFDSIQNKSALTSHILSHKSAITMQKPPLTAILALLRMMRFYSRLPLPNPAWDDAPHTMPDFARNLWAVPVVGAVLGAISGLVGLAAISIGLPPFLAAVLLITTGVIITGVFHEDGLADSCDGLWGGMTTERRLEIMRDSRIGSYGAAGLVLALLIRVGAWAELFRLLGPDAAWLAMGIGAFSRILALVPMRVLPPARADGVAGQTARPEAAALAFALFVGIGMMMGSASLAGILLAPIHAMPALFLALFVLIHLMRNKIGGHCGDVLGASQQVLEIVMLLTLAASAARLGPL